MKFADPYALKLKPSRETIIFAASQLPGKERTEEDYFLNFNDECFILADGVGNLPGGAIACKFACETALWAFKHIRQHPYYWLDKKLFMKRIFRSTNMAIWQKRRERGFENGIAANLMVFIVGPLKYWLGVAGDSSVWLLRSGLMKKLTPDVPTFEKNKQQLLGMKRLGLVPTFHTGTFRPGDISILATSGCGNYVTPSDLQTCASEVGDTVEDATRAVMNLLTAAETNGSKENMTAVIVKRIRNG